MIEINLLPSVDVLSKRDVAIREKLKPVAGGLFVLVVLDLVIFFVIKQFFTVQISGIVTKRGQLVSEAEALSPVGLGLSTIQSKLAAVAAIQSSRQDIAAVVAEVRGFLGDGMELVDLKADASGSVAFIAKATDVASFGRFVTNISDPQKGIRLSNIVLSSLRQDTGRGLSFQLSAIYLKPKEQKK